MASINGMRTQSNELCKVKALTLEHILDEYNIKNIETEKPMGSTISYFPKAALSHYFHSPKKGCSPALPLGS